MRFTFIESIFYAHSVFEPVRIRFRFKIVQQEHSFKVVVRACGVYRISRAYTGGRMAVALGSSSRSSGVTFDGIYFQLADHTSLTFILNSRVAKRLLSCDRRRALPGFKSFQRRPSRCFCDTPKLYTPDAGRRDAKPARWPIYA